MHSNARLRQPGVKEPCLGACVVTVDDNFSPLQLLLECSQAQGDCEQFEPHYLIVCSGLKRAKTPDGGRMCVYRTLPSQNNTAPK